MAGAVTALGDTLFPIQPTIGSGLLAHVKDDLSAATHFLVRLRIVHPLLAVSAVGAMLGFCMWSRHRLSALESPASRLVFWVAFWAALELAAGVVNITLGAPGWMQLVHLLLAHALWLSWVWLGALVYAELSRAPRSS
jgi:nitrate reductase NapE component